MSNHHDDGAQREMQERALAAGFPPQKILFSGIGKTEAAAEQKWYAVTGRVIEVRAEADGDVHIALQDATGDKPRCTVVRFNRDNGTQAH